MRYAAKAADAVFTQHGGATDDKVTQWMLEWI